ncbi:unnamed protein product [Arabidopsis halleri]
MDSEGNRLTYRMKQTAAKVVPRVENSENCARSGPLVHLSAKLVLQGRMWAGERTAFLSLMNVPKFLFCGELHSFRAEMPTSTIPSKSLLVVSPSSSSASANIESQVLPRLLRAIIRILRQFTVTCINRKVISPLFLNNL